MNDGRPTNDVGGEGDKLGMKRQRDRARESPKRD